MHSVTFDSLADKLSYLNNDQIAIVKEAYELAANAHKNQKRSSGESYIVHPLSVAGVLAEMHLDHESIAAALLHDVIEDTSITKAELSAKFGKNIAELVDGVTKLNKLTFPDVAKVHAESLRKMILAMSHDLRVILIKLADRVHNMRTIGSLRLDKQKRIAWETLEIYSPIANRLGIYDIFVELERISFQTIYPYRYLVIRNAIDKARGNNREILKKIEDTLITKFSETKIKDIKILGREKQVFSVYRKMKRKKIPFDQIMDIYAFRLIVPTVEECYIALGIVHSIFKPIPGKFKDYIAIPKLNGYQSLHSSLIGTGGLPIEIQIRTVEMDHHANKGIAAHWLYKSDEKFDALHIMRAQKWINHLIEFQNNTGDSLEFIEDVKTDLLPDAIYVFSPQGEIFELPRGATALDFAYYLHTDIGDASVSAYIDNKRVPLYARLASGEVIKILTSSDSHPTPDWLNFVQTSRARTAIKHYLHNQKETEAISLGKALLDKSLQDLGWSFAKISPEEIDTFLQKIKVASLDDLFREIGLGTKTAVILAHQLIPTNFTNLKNQPETPLFIKGTEGLLVKFSPCCSPIPGDEIIAYMDENDGFIIHRADCPRLEQSRLHPEKLILVKWANDIKNKFIVPVNVEMEKKLGSFAILTKAIADSDGTIEDIIIKRRIGEHYSTIIKIGVKNKEHLQTVINRILSVPTVISATRV